MKPICRPAIERGEEYALELWEETWLAAFYASTAAIVVWSKDWEVLRWNAVAEQMFGWTEEEAIAQTGPDFLVPEDVRNDPHRLSDMLSGEEDGAFRCFPNVRRDGAVIYCRWRGIKTLDSEGHVTGMVSIVRDVTDERRRIAATNATKDIQASILGALPTILVGVSASGAVILWNGPATAALGVAEYEALGRHVGELAVEWDGAAIQALVDACLATGERAANDQLPFTRRDGSAGILGVTASPLLREGGKRLGVVLSAADRTERLMLERQLVQAQKLESIGQLAAGIAHEINTPAQYASDNARYLLDASRKLEAVLAAHKEIIDSPDCHDPRVEACRGQWSQLKIDSVRENFCDAISEALEGLGRIASIVRAMKEFSHPGTEDKTPTDINRCIESTVTVSRNEWKYVATVDLDLEPDLPLVPCLAGEFNQVVVNMLVNASHAVADRYRDSGEMGLIKVSSRAFDGYVEVRIVDDGAGIPEEIRSRIFDPFFTTKEVGKGTGQGLTLAYDVIVRRHGGLIEVDSTPGVGTAFTITLPMTSQQDGDGMLRASA